MIKISQIAHFIFPVRTQQQAVKKFVKGLLFLIWRTAMLSPEAVRGIADLMDLCIDLPSLPAFLLYLLTYLQRDSSKTLEFCGFKCSSLDLLFSIF